MSDREPETRERRALRHLASRGRSGYRRRQRLIVPIDSHTSRKDHPRVSVTETLLLALAALRVVVPYVLMILAAVGVAWGVWALLF